MGMQLNLDDDLSAMVEAIERQTGLDREVVVRTALHEKRDRLARGSDADRRLQELKLVLERLTPPAGQGSYMTHAEGDAWLYDEHGLPH